MVVQTQGKLCLVCGKVGKVGAVVNSGETG